jgi:hypothetical protein
VQRLGTDRVLHGKHTADCSQQFVTVSAGQRMMCCCNALAAVDVVEQYVIVLYCNDDSSLDLTC